MDFGPLLDGTVDLSPRAEGEFRLEAERVGGLVIDPDVEAQRRAALRFLADCEGVIADLGVLTGSRATA